MIYSKIKISPRKIKPPAEFLRDQYYSRVEIGYVILKKNLKPTGRYANVF